jgi:glucosamine--fructose-6-phosphate aminotransferase (isomerizing)
MTILGPHMASEMQEASAVFTRVVMQDIAPLDKPSAIYTFARGSSDTVANVLSYAFMERLNIPMTSLPPSVFSLGDGVAMGDALALVISQSGASDDLVACAKGAKRCVAITNVKGSKVEAASERTIAVGAGRELAVPATKTVVGSIGAGMALLAAIDPNFKEDCTAAAAIFAKGIPALPDADTISKTLTDAQHIYVLGRQFSFGVAHEVALKFKETCALHAEAYSASEVLHGPLQLSTKPLTVLSLNAGDAASQPSLKAAEDRFEAEGATILRVRVTVDDLCGPASAAALLCQLYPVIHATANRLGFDPDSPKTLMKVTRTT